MTPGPPLVLGHNAPMFMCPNPLISQGHSLNLAAPPLPTGCRTTSFLVVLSPLLQFWSHVRGSRGVSPLQTCHHLHLLLLLVHFPSLLTSGGYALVQDQEPALGSNEAGKPVTTCIVLISVLLESGTPKPLLIPVHFGCFSLYRSKEQAAIWPGPLSQGLSWRKNGLQHHFSL